MARGFELLDALGEVLRGEHGRETDEGDVGGDEEDGGSKGDGGGCGEMAAPEIAPKTRRAYRQSQVAAAPE